MPQILTTRIAPFQCIGQRYLRLDRFFFMGGALGFRFMRIGRLVAYLALGAVAAAVDALDNGGHAHGLFDALHILGIVHLCDLEQHPVRKGAQKPAPFLRGQLFLCCALIQNHR